MGGGKELKDYWDVSVRPFYLHWERKTEVPTISSVYPSCTPVVRGPVYLLVHRVRPFIDKRVPFTRTLMVTHRMVGFLSRFDTHFGSLLLPLSQN